MANVKITELSAIANPASTDVLAIVDLTADITKKVTIADLLENAGDGTAAAPAFSFDSDTNTGVFLEAADKLGFSTNGVGRIYIDATGNVGIAKSNPTQTLDVNGTAAVSGALTQGGNNVVTVGDTGTVTSTMIADGTIVDADVNASAAIGLSKLATGALPTGISVASANIADGTIVNADVSATAEIAVSKLANGTARQLLQTDAAGTGVEFTSNVDVPGTLDVTGVATFDDNVTVGGNLTVNGTTTTIDSTTLVVEDKNIEMGAVTTPSDTTADGGGITLKGATDKTLTWVNSTDCWTFNQALNLTAGAQSAPALVFDADVNTGIFHPAADTIAASTSGSERLRITQNGYILLGTNSEPSGGDAHARNARFVIHGRIGNTADSGRLNLQRGSSASNGSSIGSITFTDNGNNAYARIETLADAATGTNDYPGAIVFSTTPDGTASPTEKLRISDNGSVGLGTTVPTAKLTVTDSSGTGNVNLADFYAPSASANGLIRIITRNAANTGTTSVDLYKVYQSGFSINNNDTASSNFTRFIVGASERMRIDSSGNVGIGTNSPAQALDIVGSVKSSNQFIGPTAALGSSATNPTYSFSGQQTGMFLAASNEVGFSTGGSEKVRITSSGNVGIGTSSPQTNLHLSDSNATIRLQGASTSSSINQALGTIEFYSNDVSGDGPQVVSKIQGVTGPGSSAAGGAIDFFTTLGGTGTSLDHTVRISRDGYVGIGTSSPNNLLDVQGASNPQIKVSATNTGTNSAGLYIENQGQRNWQIWADRSSDQLRIGHNGRASTVVSVTDTSVGLGVAAPTSTLHLQKDTGSIINLGTGTTTASSTQGFNFYGRFISGTTPAAPGQLTSFIREERQGSNAQFDLIFGTSFGSDATEKMRLRAGGLLGIGTSSPIAKLTSLGINSGGEGGNLCIQNTGSGVNTNVALYLTPNNGGGNDLQRTAAIKSRQEQSGNFANLEFYTSHSGNPEERMRLTSDGKFFINTIDSSLYANNASNQQGLSYVSSELGLARWSDNLVYLNRMGTDGALLRFLAQGNLEGDISVSGTTVSLNGGHLTRWSQLAGNAERIEILRGTVLSNLDEMCEWGDEDNEQLNRMQVSDVEGDRNVAGVFQSWDDDDDTYTKDFYCAMTGDFVIRIAQGTTVARGDLLMSAGDGTAKPQDDDLVRSKTIAKVTSTTVSATYADGSYCVPCVLMAC